MAKESEALTRKYRPKELKDLVGQGHMTKALGRVLQERKVHTFCFTGKSGTGKTSAARICCSVLGVGNEVQEIDAATMTGIDEWRQIRSTIAYAPIGERGAAKAIIVDEAHRLSKNTWDSLLKDLEEPPDHVYWFLCTTEPDKVPVAIRNRCAAFEMKSVSADDLFKLLCKVADDEGFSTPDEVLDLIANESDGSPRQALAYLEVAHDAPNTEKASALLRSVTQRSEPVEIARGLASGKLTFSQARQLVAGMADEPAEGARRLIYAYLSKVLMNAKDDRAASNLVEILAALQTPMPTEAKMPELLIPLGKVLLNARKR